MSKNTRARQNDRTSESAFYAARKDPWVTTHGYSVLSLMANASCLIPSSQPSNRNAESLDRGLDLVKRNLDARIVGHPSVGNLAVC